MIELKTSSMISYSLPSWLGLFIVLSAVNCSAQQAAGKVHTVQFKKHTLTTDFISEGVTVADVNRDGKTDILAGAYWFEAPGWTKHAINEGDTFSRTDYSNSFLNFSADVNHDGWADFIRIGYPGAEAAVYYNPQNKPGYWKSSILYPSVGNESPAFVDVDGDGLRDLLCNDSHERKMIWLKAPSQKDDTVWKRYVISNDTLRGTHMYTHGLGLGDVNGDGRKDVIIRDGWWECPADPKQPDWIFHPADLGKECSQMYTMDMDNDGDADILSASAHDYGIWWHEQIKDASGSISWKEHEINKDFSETHGVAIADINGDGHPDFVTGKRYFAHNGGDPGGHEPAVLYWFEYKPGKNPSWIAHQIDDDSGVGLHLVTTDMNNDQLIDIVIGNKKGVFFFEQVKAGRK